MPSASSRARRRARRGDERLGLVDDSTRGSRDGRRGARTPASGSVSIAAVAQRVAVERADGGEPAGDRARGQAAVGEAGEVGADRRAVGRAPVDAAPREEGEELGRVAPVLDDRPRRRVAACERLEERLERVPAPSGGQLRSRWPQSATRRHAERLCASCRCAALGFGARSRARARGRRDAACGSLAREAARPRRRASPCRRLSPSGSDAFVVPSVTYGPYRPSRSRTGAADVGMRAELAQDASASAAPRRLLLAEQLERLVERDLEHVRVARRASGTRPRASRTARSGRSWRRSPRRTPGRGRRAAAARGAGARDPASIVAGSSSRGQRGAPRLLLAALLGRLAELHVGPEAAGHEVDRQARRRVVPEARPAPARATRRARSRARG